MSQCKLNVIESEPATIQPNLNAFTMRVARVCTAPNSVNLPLVGTFSRADRKWLHDVSFVAVVHRIVEPPVWDEGMRVVEISRRCVGAVMIDGNNGLGIKMLAENT